MKTTHILLVAVLAATSAIQAATAERKLPAPLPEFKTPEQLAKWRGEKAKSSSPVPNSPLKNASAFFTGKPFVDETGSYVFKYRNYDPELNRWTTSDPSGFPDGANNGFYAPHPTNEWDCDGLYKYSYSIKTESINSIWTGSNPVTAYTVQPKPFVTQQFTLAAPTASGGGFAVSVMRGFELTASSIVHLPEVGSEANGGTVTGQFFSDMALHEGWHRALYLGFLDSVVTALEDWSGSYISNTFKTASQATAAAQTDLSRTLGVLTGYWNSLVSLQGTHPYPAGYVNGYTHEWEAFNPNWGQNALSQVNAFAPQFTKTPGNLE